MLPESSKGLKIWAPNFTHQNPDLFGAFCLTPKQRVWVDIFPPRKDSMAIATPMYVLVDRGRLFFTELDRGWNVAIDPETLTTVHRFFQMRTDSFGTCEPRKKNGYYFPLNPDP